MLAAGRRKKRALVTTPATYTNMSIAEQEAITCLIDAYSIIHECCQTQECNETHILTIAGQVGSVNSKLKAAGTAMTLAYIDGQQYFFDMISELDISCTNTTIPALAFTSSSAVVSTTTTSTTSTTTSSSTTSIDSTASACCPEYQHTDPIVCPILCQLIYGRRLKRSAVEDIGSNSDVTVMMTDVFIFLETRLKCFSEGARMDTLNEQAKLTEIYTEVAKVKPYLYANSTDMIFNLVQGKLLGLLEEAKGQLVTSDNFKGEENTNDVILGCMCIIISPVDQQFSPVKEDACDTLKEQDIEEMVELVAESYKMNKRGLEVDEKSLKATYLELEKASDCRMISQQQHDLFNHILKQHHVFV